MIGVLIIALALAGVLIGEIPEERFKGVFAVGAIILPIILTIALGIGAVALPGVGVAGGLLLIGLGVLDLLIGLVDFVHFLRGDRIARMQVRVILLRQLSVCSFDLVFRCAPGYAQNLVGILYHGASLASAGFFLILYMSISKKV